MTTGKTIALTRQTFVGIVMSLLFNMLSRLIITFLPRSKVKVKESHSVLSSSFVTPWTVACQVLLSTEFHRQECWSGLPFPSPGDLPDPGIEPRSPALQSDSLPSESKRKTEMGVVLSFTYTWHSLVAQMVKRLSKMRET